MRNRFIPTIQHSDRFVGIRTGSKRFTAVYSLPHDMSLASLIRMPHFRSLNPHAEPSPPTATTATTTATITTTTAQQHSNTSGAAASAAAAKYRTSGSTSSPWAAQLQPPPDVRSVVLRHRHRCYPADLLPAVTSALRYPCCPLLFVLPPAVSSDP